MNFIVTLLLAFVAGVLASGNEYDCKKQGSECMAKLIVTLLHAPDEEDADMTGTCLDLNEVRGCTNSLMENCADDKTVEDMTNMKNLIESLDLMIKEGCQGVISELYKCGSENEDYVFQCLTDNVGQVFDMMKEAENRVNTHKVDTSVLLCATYMVTADCMLERIEEKCGVDARQELEEQMEEDLPSNIQEACSSDSTRAFAVSNLSELRRRRRK